MENIEMDDDLKSVLKVGSSILIIIVSGIGGCMAGYPHYTVYQQRLEGEAELAKAEYSKRVQVANSQGRLDAAKLEALAEVERAKGVAQANTVIADSLGGPEGYLRWRYITMLDESKDQTGRTVIYIPTEAGLPLLEAGRKAK